MSANRFLGARAALAGLVCAAMTACTPADYTKSPVLAEHFAKLTPGAYAAGVDVLAECRDSGHRAVSVLFQNGNLYHYQLDMEKSTFQLEFMNTEVRRAEGRRTGWTVTLGCIGTYEDMPLNFYARTGDYRLIVKKTGIVAQVKDTILINHRFDDELKAVMGVVARAVNDASEQEKHFVAPETSWGVKP